MVSTKLIKMTDFVTFTGPTGPVNHSPTDFVTFTTAEIALLVDDLRAAIALCENVEHGDDVPYQQSYPYVNGYSKSCMRNVIDRLKKFQPNSTHME